MAFTHLLSNVMRSKCFLLYLILTLSWCLKYKTRSRWEKFASYSTPSFASSKSPFELQLGSRETPHVSQPETEEERCLRRNQRQAARAAWVRCEPSTPRRNPRRGNTFRASHQVSQNLDGSRSLILVPNFSESGSPPPSSCAAHEEGPKQNPTLAPDVGLLKFVKSHWTQESCEGPLGTNEQTLFRPSVYVDHQPLVLTWGEEKSDSPFVATTRPLSRIGPSMRIFQQASSSLEQAYPGLRRVYVGCIPVFGPSAFGLPKGIWRGTVEAPTDLP